MKLFVLHILFLGVSFSTALTLVSQEEPRDIPVEQPFEKFEETESFAKMKKWDLSAHLFRAETADFYPVHSFNFLHLKLTHVPSSVTQSPDCSRAPPVDIFCC